MVANIYVQDCVEHKTRVNPISLSYPFPLVLHIHVRVRAIPILILQQNYSTALKIFPVTTNQNLNLLQSF